MSVSLRQRIGWLNRDVVQFTTGDILVAETDQGGFARLTVKNTSRCIVLRQLAKNRLGYISEKKTADSVLFEQAETGEWTLHIIELKRTLSSSSWDTVIHQLRGAFLNALAVAGVLDIDRIEKVRCYAAYRSTKMETKDIVSTPDPIFIKSLVGEDIERSALWSWTHKRVKLPDETTALIELLQLDESGCGSYTLHSGL